MKPNKIKKIEVMFSATEQVKRLGITAPYSKTDERIYELQVKFNEIIDRLNEI